MTTYTIEMFFTNGHKTYNLVHSKQSLDRFLQYSFSLYGSKIDHYNVIPFHTIDVY